LVHDLCLPTTEAMKYPRFLAWMPLAALVAACATADPQMEPIPDGERPSPESRFGLPTLTGDWHAAGVDGVDEEAAEAFLTYPLQIRVDTQRMDSIGGRLRIGGATASWFGEIRRNGHFAVAVPTGELAGGFLAGRLSGDTLWLESGTLLDGARWGSPPRWALLREAPERRFARTREGRVLRQMLPEDTLQLAQDTLPPDTLTEEPRVAETPRTEPRPTPARPDPAAPREPRPAEPAPTPDPVPAEPAPEPQPQPEPEPEPPPREPPPLLGVPVEPEPEPPPPH
jgi:hypothetical protein